MWNFCFCLGVAKRRTGFIVGCGEPLTRDRQGTHQYVIPELRARRLKRVDKSYQRNEEKVFFSGALPPPGLVDFLRPLAPSKAALIVKYDRLKPNRG